MMVGGNDGGDGRDSSATLGMTWVCGGMMVGANDGGDGRDSSTTLGMTWGGRGMIWRSTEDFGLGKLRFDFSGIWW